MKIAKLGVVGAGQMGNGIAHVAAASGLSVTMRDLDDRLVSRGLDTIAKNLQRGVDKGKMTASDKDAVLGRIAGTTDLSDLAGCDLVVEAAVESL
ncbi:MAG TPA: 3-hydroxyacyl-CoA dehydrogenase NAD-binding domain-containing protein, partial [Candidatus Polarisedimenticolaceae bacterium]|nr:3-hydroxyacyl-CoA dehydrogenase NAD-binding domain-containing protein [Candidatus Polarisedimenticolaceae bacterium]